MDLLGRFSRESRALKTIENPNVPLSATNIYAALGWDESTFTVTPESALRVPSVWSAVNFLANTIATLPLDIYDYGSTELAENQDRVRTLLKVAPNKNQTSFKWRHACMVDVLTEGRSYTLIARRASDAIDSLHRLTPRMVTPKFEVVGGIPEIVYFVKGVKKPYRSSEIIDIAWVMKTDGLGHINPVEKLKKTIKLSLALQSYADRFFNNGGVPPLALEGPFASGASADRASEDMSQQIAQSNEKNRLVLALPSGHTLKPIGLKPEEGQMLAARQQANEEIGRMYQLSPIFLQDLSKGTMANTEQQDIQVAKHSISHWVTRIESELNLKLFGTEPKAQVDFQLDGLMRGDSKTLSEALTKQVTSGLITPNEGRKKLGLKRMDGGDELYAQMQNVPIQELGKKDE